MNSEKVADLSERVRMQRDFVIKYINAQGPHMAEAWKEAFIEAFDLEVDKGNPYQPVRAIKVPHGEKS